ncbi:MAG: hypothetical protein LBS50_01135 [Prevotellaceae bacterium]|jgi:hypothetical protein|nr:hypothetical protein [Prevotellaceae bacterium]
MQTKINKKLLINDLDSVSVQTNIAHFIKIFIAFVITAGAFGVVGFFGKTSQMFIPLIIFGSIAVCFLCYYSLTIHKNHYLSSTKSLIGQIEFYCKSGTSQSIISAIENGDYKTVVKNIVEEEASTKVVIIYSADKAFARCQVFVYEACIYEPASKIIELDEIFINEFLKKTGKK